MLRNRSRAVTTKQALMADHNPSQSSPTQIFYNTRPISSFFNFPRSRAFPSKISPFESGFALISPTSILDTKLSNFPFNNTQGHNNKPFSCNESTSPRSPRFQSPEKGGIGLADIINTVISDNHHTKPINKMVVFGSELRVQIPPLYPISDIQESQKSPADFGTKTRVLRNPGQEYPNSSVRTKVSTGCISVGEMELSEDYTCVISHGPNPKTTHIFDNCIVVESYCSLSADKAKDNNSAKLDNFLSFCYMCRKELDQKHDIYIYRGEKAFCSSECRYQQMLMDEMEI